jgi:hypothetical protein
VACQHTDDTRERCTAAGCDCEAFLHDEQSWAMLAQDMTGRTDEVVEAVNRSLARPVSRRGERVDGGSG